MTSDDAADRAWVASAKTGPFQPVRDSKLTKLLDKLHQANEKQQAERGIGYLADTQAYAPFKLVTLADVETETITWIWAHHLAAGKVHLLDGDPGMGKSLITLDWVARMTTGTPFPGQTEPREPAEVIIMTAEDGIEDTVKPRCEAAGADTSRVHAFEGIATGQLTPLGQPVYEKPKLPTDTSVLETLIRERSAKLLIIDILASYVERGLRVNDGQDIRAVLDPLKEVAERTACAIVPLRHLNKAQGLSAMYRGAGSVGLTGAARTVMLVAENPDDASIEDPNQRRKVLAIVKANLSLKAESLDYLIVEKDGYPTVRWGNTNSHSADDLMGLGAVSKDDAVTFLRDLLRDGGKWAKEVMEAGEEAGYSRHQLGRARKKAGVETRKSEYQGGYVWRLKGETS